MAKSKKTGSSPAKGKGSASKGRGGMSAKGKTASRRPDNRSAQEFSPDFYVVPQNGGERIPVAIPPGWRNPPKTPFPIKMPAIPGSPIPLPPMIVPAPNPLYDRNKPSHIPVPGFYPFRPPTTPPPPGYYKPDGGFQPLRRRGK